MTLGLIVAILAVFASASSAPGTIETRMTPALVAEALRTQGNGFYPVPESGDTLGISPVTYVTTPFSRVMAARFMAERVYKSFSAADVTPEMIAPELHVYAQPIPSGATAINVDAVVITPRGSKDRSAAIHPIRAQPLPTEFKNLLGATVDGRGLMAVFPIEVLTPDNEVRVVYDSGYEDRARLDTRKMR